METGQFKQPRTAGQGERELKVGKQLSDDQMAILADWASKQLKCSHCRRCTLKCEVLKEPALDVGTVHEKYRAIMALPESERPQAVVAAVAENYDLYHALRRCCFCGYCTSTCRSHLLAPDIMRNWRQLFMQAGFMPPDDSRIVMVDNEWHIFSAYRAIYGVAYPEFYMLRDAATWGPGYVDTVFFPGCSLVSYTPELIRAVGAWLSDHGVAWALSDDCCGSPLMSAGMFDRAADLRQKVLDQIRAAGVKRMITVCPGCGEECSELMGDEIDIVPLPEVILDLTRDAATPQEAGLSPLASDEVGSLTFFDSCHDRHDNRHGAAIRKLAKKYLPACEQREIDHRRRNSLCCGAGGAVSSYDAEITDRRVQRVIAEAAKTKADTLVTMCPTCTYTIAQAELAMPDGGPIVNRHYLELLFGIRTDWERIFAELQGMWTGEYASWLTQTFYG